MNEDAESLANVLLHWNDTIALHNILTKEGLEDDMDACDSQTSQPDDGRRILDADELM